MMLWACFLMITLIISKDIAATLDSTVITTSIHKDSKATANTINRSFVAIKPDAVHRCLIGEIIKRIEQKGLKLVAMKLLRPSEYLVREHYKDLIEKPFFVDILEFLTSGPCVAMVWEGCNAIEIIRKLVGKTHPGDAEIGTIRGDFCVGIGRNLVHSSDSSYSAEREISIWFDESDIISYSQSNFQWLYSGRELR